MAARYNVRDYFQHWVKPRSAAGKACPHACCRNHQAHPENMPVIVPNRVLRHASDEDLQVHYRKISRSDTEDAVQAQVQILAEMERRDEHQIAQHNRALEAKRRMFGKKIAHAEEIDRVFDDAESATNGYMVNRAGRDAGISDRSLFTGPESRVRRYGSEELRNYFAEHGRPTHAYMQGKDTRLGAQGSSAPRRKQYGVISRRTVSTGRGRRSLDVAVVSAGGRGSAPAG